MPQPLSNLPQVKQLYLGNNTDSPARTRPQLALGAMHVIAEWSLLESFTNLLFTRMLDGNSAQAAAIFATIKSPGGQRDAMDAVASVFLSGDQQRLDLLTAVLETIRKAAKTRNRIAHWVWGHSPNLPDAVLLADPVAHTLASALARSWNPEAGDEYPTTDRRKIFAYTIEDFEDASKRIQRAIALVSRLRMVIDPDQLAHGLAAQELSQLSAEPEIQKELDRLNKDRQSDPK